MQESRARRLMRVGRRLMPFIGPLAVAIAYGWFALGFLGDYRYQINPDGVGYIGVAQKYLRGEFFDAINAYWSPLYSWLMVPLLLVRTEPLLATKVLGLLIGGATLGAMWRLLRRCGARQDVLIVTCLAAIPLVTDAAFMVTTPDLLVGCAILLYLGGLVHPARPMGWRSGATIGLLMGLAYLAKAYALPFVIAHFGIVRLVELIAGGGPGARRSLVLSSLCSVAVLAAVVGAWSGLLTWKYGYFMTGSTGRYNLTIDAPRSPGQVMHWAGFLPPPNRTAVSSWEDVTYDIPRMPTYNPWQSEPDRQWLYARVQSNFKQLLKELERYTPWCYPILLVGLLIGFSRADLRPRRPGLALAIAILLYPCGYLLLHIERRFLVALALLLLVAAAYFVTRAAARGLLSGWWRRSIAMGLIGWTFLATPQDLLTRNRQTGQRLAETADALRSVIPAGARVAADGDWSTALFVAFHLDWRFYGEARPRQRADEMKADLDRLGVEYLLLWPRRNDWPAREGWIELPHTARQPFKIYRRPAGTTRPAS